MRSMLVISEAAGTGQADAPPPVTAPVIALPESFPVETATLGRKPNNDGDNSGAMWFE